MGLLDDINAQAQERASDSETFVPSFINNESDGSDVTSQILNAGNAAQNNQAKQGTSAKSSSNNGLPWYLDNRNLRQHRQASNDESDLNYTVNQFANMRFDKTVQEPDLYRINENNQSVEMIPSPRINFTANDLVNMRFDQISQAPDLYRINENNQTLEMLDSPEINYTVKDILNKKYDEIYSKEGCNSNAISGDNFNPYNIPGIIMPIYLENEKNKKIADDLLGFAEFYGRNLGSRTAYRFFDGMYSSKQQYDEIDAYLRSIKPNPLIPDEEWEKLKKDIAEGWPKDKPLPWEPNYQGTIDKMTDDYLYDTSQFYKNIADENKPDKLTAMFCEYAGGSIPERFKDVLSIPYGTVKGAEDAEKAGNSELLGAIGGASKELIFRLMDHFSKRLPKPGRVSIQTTLPVGKEVLLNNEQDNQKLAVAAARGATEAALEKDSANKYFRKSLKKR